MFRLTASLILLFYMQRTSAQSDPQKDEATIKAARQASNTAITNHNVAGIVQNMLPDYIIITGRGKQVAGRDSLTAFWKQTFMDMPGVAYIRTPLQITISKNDTLAWENGKWEGINSYSSGGNYSAMWRKVNGAWKTQAELFVSLEK